MRHIEGFVCTTTQTHPIKQEFLFGPTTKDSHFSHQNFRTNGLVPFRSAEQAIEELACLQKRKKEFAIKRLGIAQIGLDILESEEELSQVEHQQSFVIVTSEDVKQARLLGKWVKNLHRSAYLAYAPVADMEQNGFKPLIATSSSLENIMYAYTEVRRQGHVPAHIAGFSFTRLKR